MYHTLQRSKSTMAAITALLAEYILIGPMLAPASAHDSSVTHLWTKHVKPLSKFVQGLFD